MKVTACLGLKDGWPKSGKHLVVCSLTAMVAMVKSRDFDEILSANHLYKDERARKIRV